MLGVCFGEHSTVQLLLCEQCTSRRRIRSRSQHDVRSVTVIQYGSWVDGDGYYSGKLDARMACM